MNSTEMELFANDIHKGSMNKLVKTKMAKSVLDAGWGQLRAMLEYKSRWAGVVYMEINENYTTQTCSCCGAISANSPKGRAGLRIREWTCTGCGALHDRDVNAAKNILALGHERLAVGIPFLQVGGGCQTHVNVLTMKIHQRGIFCEKDWESVVRLLKSLTLIRLKHIHLNPKGSN